MKKQVAKETNADQEEPRKTICARNISARRWDALREKSKKEGIAVWLMLDEALDYILTK